MIEIPNKNISQKCFLLLLAKIKHTDDDDDDDDYTPAKNDEYGSSLL
jgi:hypothetical protein